ncbi:MAG: ribosomal protein S18-alanine N-acetyltransferase [Burkholderiales bacterium]
MSALPNPPEARLATMAHGWLDAVVAVEQMAYSHPWTRANFSDSLAAGYEAQVLTGGDELIGYFVAFHAIDEVHLLNLTVTPAHQRQGWARLLLDALAIWSRGKGARQLWLEVRIGNLRAQHVYRQHGFSAVGRRRNYYPATPIAREDAVVMSLKL